MLTIKWSWRKIKLLPQSRHLIKIMWCKVAFWLIAIRRLCPRQDVKTQTWPTCFWVKTDRQHTRSKTKDFNQLNRNRRLAPFACAPAQSINGPVFTGLGLRIRIRRHAALKTVWSKCRSAHSATQANTSRLKASLQLLHSQAKTVCTLLSILMMVSTCHLRCKWFSHQSRSCQSWDRKVVPVMLWWRQLVGNEDHMQERLMQRKI